MPYRYLWKKCAAVGMGFLKLRWDFLFFFFEIPLAGRRKLTRIHKIFRYGKKISAHPSAHARTNPLPLLSNTVPLACCYEYSAPRWTLPPERKSPRYFAFSRAYLYDNKEWIWAWNLFREKFVARCGWVDLCLSLSGLPYSSTRTTTGATGGTTTRAGTTLSSEMK